MNNIYVRLIEVVETYVPCSSKKISSDDIFEIISNEAFDLEDSTSVWEFFPGDIVRCYRHEGNWFAKELVSSNFPDRKTYQLIFLIVKSSGEIIIDELKEYEIEIEQLCLRSDIVQKEHPAVQVWLKRNCNKLLWQ